jgi:hypothetical protein
MPETDVPLKTRKIMSPETDVPLKTRKIMSPEHAEFLRRAGIE